MIDYNMDDVGDELITPEVSTNEAVTYCLQALVNDDTHYLTEELVPHLTYQEVIETLIAVKEEYINKEALTTPF